METLLKSLVFLLLCVAQYYIVMFCIIEKQNLRHQARKERSGE